MAYEMPPINLKLTAETVTFDNATKMSREVLETLRKTFQNFKFELKDITTQISETGNQLSTKFNYAGQESALTQKQLQSALKETRMQTRIWGEDFDKGATTQKILDTSVKQTSYTLNDMKNNISQNAMMGNIWNSSTKGMNMTIGEHTRALDMANQKIRERGMMLSGISREERQQQNYFAQFDTTIPTMNKNIGRATSFMGEFGKSLLWVNMSLLGIHFGLAALFPESAKQIAMVVAPIQILMSSTQALGAAIEMVKGGHAAMIIGMGALLPLTMLFVTTNDALRVGLAALTGAMIAYSAVLQIRKAIQDKLITSTILVHAVSTPWMLPVLGAAIAGGIALSAIALSAQHGADFITSGPTYLRVGEVGPEHVRVTPAPIERGIGGGEGINIYGSITIVANDTVSFEKQLRDHLRLTKMRGLSE